MWNSLLGKCSDRETVSDEWDASSGMWTSTVIKLYMSQSDDERLRGQWEVLFSVEKWEKNEI